MPDKKKKTGSNLESRRYETKSGVTSEIMPDGSKRELSSEEYATSPANPYFYREGSPGSINNNPHMRGTRQSFDWNKKYGDTPPAITMSEDIDKAKLRQLDQLDMLDFKNEEYVKQQKRQSSPFKSVYDMTEKVGDKVVDKINVLGEQGAEKLNKANEKLQETSERLKDLGQGVRDRIKRKEQ